MCFDDQKECLKCSHRDLVTNGMYEKCVGALLGDEEEKICQRCHGDLKLRVLFNLYLV